MSVGWGVVGCGWVARDYAIPAIATAARLAAVYDADPTLGEGLGARRAPSLSDLVEDPSVEAIYVATPNHAHAEGVIAAARAGKAVLCEKPIAIDVAAAQRMIAICHAARVPYATAFDQRFHGAHRMLRRLVAEGALGKVSQARIHYACWLPEGWTDDNWRIDPSRAGGGAVIDLAPHGIDLIATICDVAPVEVAIMLQRRVHPYAVDDGGVLLVRYEGDLLATLSVGYNCPDALPRRRLEIIGTAGSAVAENTMGQTAGGTLTLHSADGTSRPLEIEDDRPPFVVQIEAFSAHVRGAPYPGSPSADLAAFACFHNALSRAERLNPEPMLCP